MNRTANQNPTNPTNQTNPANPAQSTKDKGNEAESLAKIFLQNKGFEIVESNYFTRYGEIDIIATKDSIYHFIEVKSGKNFEPLQNVTPKKLNHIIDSIHIYLANHSLDTAFCVDIITIRDGKITFFENVTA